MYFRFNKDTRDNRIHFNVYPNSTPYQKSFSANEIERTKQKLQKPYTTQKFPEPQASQVNYQQSSPPTMKADTNIPDRYGDNMSVMRSKLIDSKTKTPIAEVKFEIEQQTNIQQDIEVLVKRVIQLEESVYNNVKEQKTLETGLKSEIRVFEDRLIEMTSNLETGVKNTLEKLRNEFLKELQILSNQERNNKTLQRDAHDIESNLSQSWQMSNVAPKASAFQRSDELKSVLSRIQNNLGKLN